MTTNAGENAYVTFTGAPGRRVLLKVAMNMSSGAFETINLYDPSNQSIGGTGLVQNGTHFIDTKDAASPETYRIAIGSVG